MINFIKDSKDTQSKKIISEFSNLFNGCKKLGIDLTIDYDEDSNISTLLYDFENGDKLVILVPGTYRFETTVVTTTYCLYIGEDIEEEGISLSALLSKIDDYTSNKFIGGFAGKISKHITRDRQQSQQQVQQPQPTQQVQQPVKQAKKASNTQQQPASQQIAQPSNSALVIDTFVDSNSAEGVLFMLYVKGIQSPVCTWRRGIDVKIWDGATVDNSGDTIKVEFPAGNVVAQNGSEWGKWRICIGVIDLFKKTLIDDFRAETNNPNLVVDKNVNQMVTFYYVPNKSKRVNLSTVYNLYATIRKHLRESLSHCGKLLVESNFRDTISTASDLTNNFTMESGTVEIDGGKAELALTKAALQGEYENVEDVSTQDKALIKFSKPKHPKKVEEPEEKQEEPEKEPVEEPKEDITAEPENEA